MLVLLTCALIHALLIGDGTCLSGPNVCYWIASQEDYMYCCLGFEQIGNQCEACKIGFTTTKLLGSPCKPCTSLTFGKNCSGICSCSATKRCDHVYGSCTYEEENKTLNGYRSQSNSSEKQQSAIKDCEDIHDDAKSNEINAVDDGINTYHVIDESQMDKSRDEPNSGNPYLNVLFSESDSVDEEDSNTCNDGYLVPYHLTREHLSRDFDGELNHNDCEEDGYLLSYNALLDKHQSLKHIIKTAVISTEAGESFSTTPSDPHTDLERYMQMHGQLQN
ncbi:unnamed protein product [Mytilus edulis]|uniref:Uncharacterized protein n=1 Tax=Mytilus edulis TaxID=6550 RepID=A0A8S3QPT8_MYTED|nr:unnamed protein product [Mytilus edulis]